MLELSDRIAIEQSICRYFHLVDMGRASEAAAFFTAAGRMTFAPGSPKPGTIEGAAIPAAMAARQAQTDVVTRHAVTNIALDPRDDGSVRAYGLLTLYRRETASDATICTVADVEDIYVRDQGAWRISERLITPIFTGC